MNKELDNRLCKDYPHLYADRQADPKSTAMCWGFECGNGWYTLIDVLSELLVKHNPNITAAQVKEKFGSLHFYHNCQSAYSSSIEMTAQLVSKTACEQCGAPAIQSSYDGWYETLCKAHRKDDTAAQEDDVDVSGVKDLNLGYGWLRLAAILMRLAEFNTEQNDMLAAKFEITKDQNGRFAVQYLGGDEMTRGMVDLISGYANRIDEDTGIPINHG